MVEIFDSFGRYVGSIRPAGDSSCCVCSIMALCVVIPPLVFGLPVAVFGLGLYYLFKTDGSTFDRNAGLALLLLSFLFVAVYLVVGGFLYLQLRGSYYYY